MIKTGSFCLLVVLFISCTNSKQENLIGKLRDWEQREILFPEELVFTRQGKDTVMFPIRGNYKIVSYIDSKGCTNCKMRLAEWNDFISYLDSNFLYEVPVYFFFHPKDMKEILYLLRRDNFKYPICLDINDSFNSLNNFPMDLQFQTFLLDKENKVLAIGNPVHNPKVKELYLAIIQGEDVKPNGKKNVIQTEVNVGKTIMSLGHFDWQEEQNILFILKNTGKNLLVIQDVITSCGCTKVAYLKEPVQPGDSMLLNVNYKAEYRGNFNKTITVYCNAKSSPVVLKVTGNAE